LIEKKSLRHMQGNQEDDVDKALGKRRKQRLSVKNLTLSINGKTYRIFNINEYGVGFLIDSPEEIAVGTEIKPIILDGNLPVKLAGIPRHISHYQTPTKQLYFKSGWVCGAEFTTQQDINGWKLFRKYIAENIDQDIEAAAI
jgi:hypothetical protein